MESKNEKCFELKIRENSKSDDDNNNNFYVWRLRVVLKNVRRNENAMKSEIEEKKNNHSPEM